MPALADFDLRQAVVSNTAFGPNEIKQIAHAISADYGNFRTLRDATLELGQQSARTPAAGARLGVCQYLIGKYTEAIQTLTNADGGALTHFYLGKAYLAQDKYAEALTAYESAEKAGYNRDDVALAKAEALRYKGDPAGALKILDNLSGAVEQTAEYLYQRSSTVAALGGGTTEVVALLERAIDSDPLHPGVLFGLALQNDRAGNDDFARQLYERASKQFPTNVGTLLNLGLLYEDIEHFERAKQCYQRILDAFPAHEKARLYFKDADASRDMYYDEEARRRQDRLAQILSVPVTDFELSVRSRNCLQKMGIMTLGDLTRDDRAGAACPARTLAKPRSWKFATCSPPRASSWASSPRPSGRRSRSSKPAYSAKTSGPCWTGPSPTSTSRCGPASAWCGWALPPSANWSAARATTCWSARISASPA